MVIQGVWLGVYGQHVHGLLLDGVAHGQELLDGGRLVAFGADHGANGIFVSMGKEVLDTLHSLTCGEVGSKVRGQGHTFIVVMDKTQTLGVYRWLLRLLPTHKRAKPPPQV